VRKLLVLRVVGLVLTSLIAVAAQAAKPVIVERNNSFTRHFANLPECESFGSHQLSEGDVAAFCAALAGS
jgi:hypothetical protein